jgi:aminopeptidase
MERFMERWSSGALRWCGTLFPTHAHAQDAGMSLCEYEEFVFSAGMLDRDDPAVAWSNLYTELQRIARWLGQHDEIHIVAPDTDLIYRVGGRKWIDASGINNFPDGEVFTSPIESSVNGTVRFSYPAVYGGNEVQDVRLTFRDGKVIEATATHGQAFLNAMLDQDPGARYVGEVAFGMNYGIKRFTRNILFDEKLGGTMHVALGMSIPSTGGQNTSALHWDMVCDLRAGKVYADGQLCYEAGRFTI